LTILREHGSAAGLHRGFRIAGEAERVATLAEAVRITERKAASLLRAISKAKRTPCATSDDIAEATSAYQRALAVRNWVDFDDLVRLPVEILAKDPALAALWRDRFRWISVDEFQDADEQQYRLLTLLAPADGNLCVIGDPNQAIYGFRGADASCFERFSQDYPGAAVVRLSRNYRSSGTIVAAASQIIADSPQNGLAELVRGMHERITIHAAATERAEAEFIVQTIERLIGGHNFFSIDSGRATGVSDTRLGFADFAVLARTDTQSAALAEALSRSGIPFKKHSHDALAQEPGVRAILQELDAVAAGEPEGLVDALNGAAARVTGRAATDAAMIRTALQRLVVLAASCADRARFADALALASEADFWNENADRVSLLTLHAAKGLEFSVVFIVGLEDGLLPLHWNGLDAATAAEERRLLYVGMTRAKEQLILTRALKRLWRGRLRSFRASPFLDDIESELLKHQPMHPLRSKPHEKQLQLL
jgi:ATP-dependent DNA helicase UvrD/PcrA